MITSITKLIGLGLVPLVVAVALQLTNTPALAQPQPPPINQPTVAAAPAAQASSFTLCAAPATVTMPDGQVIDIWGFGQPSGTAGCEVQLPGPVLRVTEGDAVTVELSNFLPVATSIIFPGQTGVEASGGSAGLFTQEAPADNGATTVTYTFTAGAPGTYLYESGTAEQPQTAMGLYGALIVDPATPGQAYNDGSTAYNVEEILVLSELDPALNTAVAGGGSFDLLNYRPTYWLLNGRAYPDVLLADNDPSRPNQPYSAAINMDLSAGETTLLVRYVNAGGIHHTMSLLGQHQRVIARNADLLDFANQQFDAVAETIPSGHTADVLISPGGAGGSFPLYNRQLHITNGAPGPAHFAPGGGMMTFVTATVNTPPVAADDGYSVNQGATLSETAPGVLANDNDGGDGPGPLTAVLVTPPANHDVSNAGPFVLNSDGSFTYVHDGSAATTDSFTYKANDGVSDGNVATVTITVTPTVHIGDLDGLNVPLGFTSLRLVTITAHDGGDSLVDGANVSATWSTSAPASCVTGLMPGSGACAVLIFSSQSGLTLTVDNVTDATRTYEPGDNHDPDGDSDGTTITVPGP